MVILLVPFDMHPIQGPPNNGPHPRGSNKYFPQPEPIPALKTEVQGDCLFIHLHDIIIDWH